MASLRVAELRQIAQHQIVALLVLQHLGERVAADRGLDGVLHVRDVDLKRAACSRLTVKFRLGWPDHAEQSQVLEFPRMPAHHADDLVGLAFEQFSNRRRRS